MTTLSHLADAARPNATAIATVFEKLLSSIVRGTFPPGARLPAERELARTLGASRPTLREALRQLGEWDLVEPRRGSGVVVQPWREWSLEVMPAYMRYGRPGPGQPSLGRILVDAFQLRRTFILENLRQMSERLPPGSMAPARAAMARAWSYREDTLRFNREDFEVMRILMEAAGFIPGLWLLNRIAAIWFDMSETIKLAIKPAEDYVNTYTKFFDLIDAGDGVAAHDVMAAYLERHDAELIKLLQLFT